MAEEINNQSVEQETEVKTYTADEVQAELTRVGTKEARKAEQSILKQFGLSSKEDLPAFLEKLSNSKETSTSESGKPDETAETIKALQDNVQALLEKNKENEAMLLEKQQIEILSELNVPKEQLKYYRFEANQMVNDEISFEEAAKQFIKENPLQERPPAFYAGAGKTAVQKADLKGLSYMERLKLTNPVAYAEYNKK